MRTLFFTLLLCLLPSLAFADPPEPAPLTAVPPGPDTITVIKKGEPAPHDGQLFDQATAIRWANFLQQATYRLKMDVLYQYKLDQADNDGLKKQLAAEEDRNKQTYTEMQKKLADAQKQAADPPFYKTFGFGFGLGIAITTVVVVGAAVLVNSVK